ncbi:hypothetical protein [Glaciibacter psychrotolerans]|uniref:MFS family permease n=1 Tax=Glaciibacter psychrotolerans TaxID=670054 RepID=A0A7Z0J790_9MICO|nr:hypothetical protein [Leifsonia psychrotolerans]NYJ21036.1 MFS family permease [Leifsonia psychrotolerans]
MKQVDGRRAKLGAVRYAALVACSTIVVSIIASVALSTGALADRVGTALTLFLNAPMLVVIVAFILFFCLLLWRLAPASVGWIGLGWRGALASIAAVTATALAFGLGDQVLHLIAGDAVAPRANPFTVTAITLFYFGYIGGPVWVGIIAALPLRLAACGTAEWPRMSGGHRPTDVRH